MGFGLACNFSIMPCLDLSVGLRVTFKSSAGFALILHVDVKELKMRMRSDKIHYLLTYSTEI